MNLTTRVGFLAGAAALTLTSVGQAETTEDVQALKAQVQELTAKVSQLESGDNWLTEQRAEEVRGIVQDVLADADTRQSLLNSGMQAGYDDGFTISSPDGNYLLRVNGQLQVRWIYNTQDELGGASIPTDSTTTTPGNTNASTIRGQARTVQTLGTAGFVSNSGPDESRSGFENTRTKIWFSGHVFNPQWQYVIEMGVVREDLSSGSPDGDGDFGLLDAYIRYDWENGWGARVGQFNAPFTREQLIDSRYRQFIERSIEHQYFTAGRMQGAMLDWTSDSVRAWAAVGNGFNQINSVWSFEDTEPFALAARAEWKLSGNWAQFAKQTSPQGEEMGVLLGGALQWQKEEFGTTSPNELEAETTGVTLDATINGGGWNVFGAFNWRDLDQDGDVVLTDSLSQMGFLIQGGFYLTPEWELYARYEWADADFPDGPVGAPYSVEDLSIITLGTNYYFNPNVKFSADLGFGLDQVEDVYGVYASDISGYRSDTAGDDGQFVIRTQLQLIF